MGTSPAALGPTLSMDISVNWSGTRRLRALHVRTGDEFTSGSWKVELLDPSNATLLSWVTTLSPNAWNKLELPQPLQVSALKAHISPVGAAEMEFRAWDNTPQLYLDFWPDALYGESPYFDTGRLQSWYTYLLGADGGTLPTGNGNSWYRSVLVLESDDREGPFPPPGCADASTEVSGNPYFEVVLATAAPDGGLLTQTFGHVFQDTTRNLNVSMYRIDSPFAPSGTIELLRNGNSEQYGLIANGGAGFYLPNSCFPVPGVDAGIFALRLRPDGGASGAYALSAGSGLSVCDAPARATWGGSVFSLNDDPGRDLVFQANAGVSFPYFEDADSDGYGNAQQRTFWCGGALPGYVQNADDCVDHDSAIHPDAGEFCNGIDDDCDGVVDAPDPDLIREGCELSQGICAGSLHSTAECLNGSWMACGAVDYGATFTSSEAPACDGTDDDCDGVIETIVPCEKQLGVCAGATLDLCRDAGYCDGPDYGPSYEPFELSCDGLDNDCDGETDEGCAAPDAGPAFDGGARVDAGSPDSGEDGSAADGGNSTSQPRACGCSGADLSGVATPLILAALLCLRRRRR